MVNCSNKMPLIESMNLECAEGMPLLPEEKPDISCVDSLGNVYDNARKIVGWWINGPNKTIRAKMYESGIEYSLEMDRKLHKSKRKRTILEKWSQKMRGLYQNIIGY